MSAQTPWRMNLPEIAGYRPLGDLMGAHPDLAIFRRFRNVGALDLLYRQSELQIALSAWAHAIELDLASSDDNRKQFDIDFSRLLISIDKDDWTGSQRRQWMQVSEKLGEYYDRLLKYRQICAMSSVDKIHLEQLRDHLTAKDKGEDFLRGVEARSYKLDEADLTSIISPSDADLFTYFSRGAVVNWLQKYVYGKLDQRTITVPKITGDGKYTFWFEEYSPENLCIISRVLVSVFTALVITIAIVTLNVFQGANARIVLIFFHSLIFSGAMAVLARARAAEVFAISAAYAAVLVVYASGSSSLFGKPSS